MVTSSVRLENSESANQRCCSELDGGRYWIRTSDFHRVNFEVVNLKPFACLAFPLSRLREKPVKQPDLVTNL